MQVAGDLAISASGLVKNFGGKRVVDGVDVSVPGGAIYGVLGPNGAGKTTTLRMLLGIIEPDEGTRTLLGHVAPRDASDRVGYLPEERGLYPGMKSREAIAFMGALRGLAEQATLAAIGLDDAEQHAQRRGLARAIGAEHAIDQPLGDGDADTVHCTPVAEALDETRRAHDQITAQIGALHQASW